MRRFFRDRRGGVAVSLAVSVIPLLGIAGMALDYSRALTVRTYLQQQSDAAALGAAQDGLPAGDAQWLARARAEASERYGGQPWLASLKVDGDWRNATDYGVEMTAEVPVTFLKIVPGVDKMIDVGVRSIARYSEPELIYTPPTVSELDPDAADYNRIYVYCFDPAKRDDPLTRGRSQMTAIADNGGTRYKFTMPACGPGEALSYRLHNVRNAHDTPSLWDSTSAETYEHYTDTVISGGVESYGLTYDLIETVLCDRQSDCRPQNQGGIIPEGTERQPERATGACEAGKFMYYGWEDRPPGAGWSDRDYNDIRIVIGCPSWEKGAARGVWLVK